jgi:rhodanese-related sulfurtransferase
MVLQVPPTVEVADVRELLAADRPVRLLDVRTPAEYETSHIPGAVNVPLDAVGEHAETLRDGVAEPVVLVCRSGARASTAQERLSAAGMRDVAVLSGGMLAWERAGEPVRRGRQRWELERQIRLVAGLIVLVAVLASVVWAPAKWVAAFVGAGLTFAALTNTCLMGMLLARLPYNRGASCDVEGNVAVLTGDAR